MKRYNPVLRPVVLLPAVSLFAILVTLTACDILDVDGEQGKGQINFHLTDATDAAEMAFTSKEAASKKPSADGLEEVNIDIRELRALFYETVPDSAIIDTTDNEFDEENEFEEDEEEEHGKWITIDTTQTQLNLLELTNSDTLLAEVELEDGFYSEIRLILGDGNNVVINGETHPLKVPSGQESGYKIKLDESLHAGEIMDVSIEFDAENSVHVTGNGMYILKPVLRISESTTDP